MSPFVDSCGRGSINAYDKICSTAVNLISTIDCCSLCSTFLSAAFFGQLAMCRARSICEIAAALVSLVCLSTLASANSAEGGRAPQFESSEGDPPPVLDYRPLRYSSPDKAKLVYGERVSAWVRAHRHPILTIPQQQGVLSIEEVTLLKARAIVASVQDDEGDRMGQGQRKRRTEAMNKTYEKIAGDLLTYGEPGPGTISALKSALRTILEPTVMDGDGNRAWRESILSSFDSELTYIANERVAYHNEIVDTRRPLINERGAVAQQEAARWQAHLDFVAKYQAPAQIHNMFQQMYNNMNLQMGVGASDPGKTNGGTPLGKVPNSISLDYDGADRGHYIPPYLQENNPLPAQPSLPAPDLRLH